MHVVLEAVPTGRAHLDFRNHLFPRRRRTPESVLVLVSIYLTTYLYGSQVGALVPLQLGSDTFMASTLIFYDLWGNLF